MTATHLAGPVRAAGRRWAPPAVGALLLAGAAVLCAAGTGSAQTAEGTSSPAERARLGGAVRDGVLFVEGSGFAPGERLTVRVQTRGLSPGDPAAFRSFEVAAVADAAGAFAARTDAAVPPVVAADLLVTYGCAPAALPTPAPAAPGAPPRQSATSCERVIAGGIAFARATAPAAASQLPRTGAAPHGGWAPGVPAAAAAFAVAAGLRRKARSGRHATPRPA